MSIFKRFFIVALFFSFECSAAALSYECLILDEKIVEDNGSLQTDHKFYKGNKFNVDKASGVVLGGGLGNSSYPTKIVLDPGGKEQSYKLIYLSREITGTNGGRNAVYLTIQEYSESMDKPFVVITGLGVLSGVCN